jgi:RNA polymerase primary sigma factor
MRQLKISRQITITHRESQSPDKYLQEIGKVNLLTTDEAVMLAKRMKDGDQIVLGKLTKTNLRFVVSVSKQYQNQGLSLGDRINEGNLGLIKSAQSIFQALAEHSRIVRLPLNRVGSLNKTSNTFSKLEQKYERKPSPEELADVLGLTMVKVVDTMKISGRHVSMAPPFVSGKENRLLDGPEFSLTRERVRQSKEKAVRRGRHPSRSEALRPYVG